MVIKASPPQNIYGISNVAKVSGIIFFFPIVNKGIIFLFSLIVFYTFIHWLVFGW